MTNQEKTTPLVNIADQLRKNWMIIVFIGSVLMAWSNVQNNLKSNEKEIENVKMTASALEIKMESSKEQVASLSGDIKEIKASLSFIKDRLTTK